MICAPLKSRGDGEDVSCQSPLLALRFLLRHLKAYPSWDIVCLDFGQFCCFVSSTPPQSSLQNLGQPLLPRATPWLSMEEDLNPIITPMCYYPNRSQKSQSSGPFESLKEDHVLIFGGVDVVTGCWFFPSCWSVQSSPSKQQHSDQNPPAPPLQQQLVQTQYI